MPPPWFYINALQHALCATHRTTRKYGHNITLKIQVSNEILQHSLHWFIVHRSASLHLQKSYNSLPYIPSSMAISYSLHECARAANLQYVRLVSRIKALEKRFLRFDHITYFSQWRGCRRASTEPSSQRGLGSICRAWTALSRGRVWSCVSERDFVEVNARNGKIIFSFFSTLFGTWHRYVSGSGLLNA